MQYLRKAREDLADATAIAAIGLTKIAARTAYYAAFHAAEAYINEQTDKVAKTHSGVHKEFARLIRAEPGLEWANVTFLARSYRYKTVSDYEVALNASIGSAEAKKAIDEATAFVSAVEAACQAPQLRSQ